MEGLQYLFTSKIGLRASQSKNQYARTTAIACYTEVLAGKWLRTEVSVCLGECSAPQSRWNLCTGTVYSTGLVVNHSAKICKTYLGNSISEIWTIVCPQDTQTHTNTHTHARSQNCHTHTHTHERALRTVIANLVVECILHAKTLPLTGMGRWRGPAKYQEATIAIASAEKIELKADPSPFQFRKKRQKIQIAANVQTSKWKCRRGVLG